MAMMGPMADTPASIDAYIAALPDGVQQIFAAVRETVLRLAPDAEEAIKYGMPSWRLSGTMCSMRRPGNIISASIRSIAGMRRLKR